MINTITTKVDYISHKNMVLKPSLETLATLFIYAFIASKLYYSSNLKQLLLYLNKKSQKA